MRLKIAFLVFVSLILLAVSAYAQQYYGDYYGYSGSGGGSQYSDSGYGGSYYGGGNYRSSGFYGNSYRGSSRSSNYYDQPDFRNYYSSEGRLRTYYPILADPESCIAREDIILQVSPIGGCQPAVVRSDLLAEQNVPVFCQIEAIKVNPLIDIKEIRNIRFRGDYPPEVVGTGFHPSRAALRTRDRLLGSPVVNNIGYVVVVLRQNDKEDELPDLVNFTLHAQLEYYADNALGIGRANFLLERQTEDEWRSEKFKQSFWDGRFFMRLEEADPGFVDVSIYQGDRRVSSLRVERGRQSREIYLPGSYCQFGLRIAYDGFQAAQDIAKLKVGDDVIDVYRGSRFLNKCVVRDVVTGDFGDGFVDISCGSERFVLSIGAGNFSTVDLAKIDKRQLEPYFPDTIKKLEDLELVQTLNDFVIIERNGVLSVFGSFFMNSTDAILYNNTGGIIVSGSPSDELSSFGISLHSLTGFDSGRGLVENIHPSADAEKYFMDSIEFYEQVVDDYPLETRNQLEGEETFGEISLSAAIDLARLYGKEETQARLINNFLDLYPSSTKAISLTRELNDLSTRDFSSASTIVNLDNGFTPIRLLDVKRPKERANADFTWDNNRLKINFEETAGFNFGNISLTRIDVNSVQVTPDCKDREDRIFGGRVVTLFVNGPAESVCGKVLKLENVMLQELANVRIIPSVRGASVETNFTVGIGIEKRAIKLNPEKAREKADELNETIEKWESVSEGLGKVVKGLKGACFATAAVLNIKNFFTGLDGEGAARQRVMKDYWRGECQRLIGEGTYSKSSECYYDKRNEIGQDVETMKELLGGFDGELSAIEGRYDKPVKGLGGLFGERYINGKGASGELAGTLKVNADYWNYNITDSEGRVVGGVRDLINITDGYDRGDYTYAQLRDLRFNLDIIYSDAPEHLKKGARERISNIGEIVRDNRDIYQRFKTAGNLVSEGYASAAFADSRGQRRRVIDVVQISGSSTLGGYNWGDERITHSATFVTGGDPGDAQRGIPKIVAGEYVIGLRSVRDRTDEFAVARVFNIETGHEVNVSTFTGAFDIGLIVPSDQISYNNRYINPEVRFFETEPYRGLPAIVPFDRNKGWYAATRQTLPGLLGNIGTYESSGRVASFFLCNVGKNGREQFSEGFGDDQCQMINLNTGQPLDKFYGLSNSEAERLINRATSALQEAAQQYGSGRSTVTIDGQTFRVGDPAANAPGTECAEFMSPEECNLLFNVCDPVICPSSRCDLGGAYPVADVIQTGIVGSTLLCLPNIKEDIAIPVCLTGIKVGIDSYTSILKSHQACLREAAENGRLVGICDEITSVYTCEFFWRQVAPATSVLIPKLVEVIKGETRPRGGGEYISVQGAWDNTQKSIDYFTNNYAVNSLDAFRLRSSADVGSTFCRAFIGGKGIDAFETLIEPDSPVQFYAWFSSTTHTTATVPATAQYKVFYHIFAGEDIGVSYNVYLRNPPDTSYYQTTPTIPVDVGFIPQGEFATETIDFTAPEGYQELCVRVNDREECGFKQVSTDFAVNYLRDLYVAGELNRTIITSERECISGSPNPYALIQPNIQSGVEEFALPEVYNRGIIRICATRNPGSATDPTRFTNVGHCGDEKLICWLDKKSVDDAITQNNIGLKNQTLTEIERFQRDNLVSEGEILPESQIKINIEKLSGEIKAFDGKDMVNARELLDSIDSVLSLTFFNDQKAHLVLLKARIYDVVAKQLFGIRQVKSTGRAESSGDSSGSDRGTSSSSSSTNGVDSEILDQSIEQAMERTGDYSENKVFVDALYSNGLLSDEEYDEINGWNGLGEEDMDYVTGVLLSKKAGLLGGWESASDYAWLNADQVNRKIFVKGNERLTLIDELGMISTTAGGSRQIGKRYRWSSSTNSFIIGFNKNTLEELKDSISPDTMEAIENLNYARVVISSGFGGDGSATIYTVKNKEELFEDPESTGGNTGQAAEPPSN